MDFLMNEGSDFSRWMLACVNYHVCEAILNLSLQIADAHSREWTYQIATSNRAFCQDAVESARNQGLRRSSWKEPDNYRTYCCTVVYMYVCHGDVLDVRN